MGKARAGGRRAVLIGRVGVGKLQEFEGVKRGGSW
jgi:hypothetical protein